VPATEIPTDTPEPTIEAPTETDVPPTELPTETEVPPTELPTATDVPPTEVPTETPAPTQAPTEESPAIEPVTGTYEPTESGDGTGGVSPTVVESPPVDGSPEPGAQLIVPAETPDSGAPTISPKDGPNQQPNTPSSESLNGGNGTDPGTSLGAVDPGTQITGGGNGWTPYGLVTAPTASTSGMTVADDGRGKMVACTADGRSAAEMPAPATPSCSATGC
jgi:hypothetical protein